MVGPDDLCIGKLTALRLVGVLRRLAAGCRDDAPLEQADKDLLAGTVSALVDREHTTFRSDDIVKDVLREISKSNEGGFIIQDDERRLQGVITRVNFIHESRLRVVMVDHNEVGQAVDGIEEAEVVEIIDHHRLAARTTSLPITFINRVVGSTCTIVADMYRTAGAIPPAADAGLMLAAMLSDTHHPALPDHHAAWTARSPAGWPGSPAWTSSASAGRCSPPARHWKAWTRRRSSGGTRRSTPRETAGSASASSRRWGSPRSSA